MPQAKGTGLFNPATARHLHLPYTSHTQRATRTQKITAEWWPIHQSFTVQQCCCPKYQVPNPKANINMGKKPIKSAQFWQFVIPGPCVFCNLWCVLCAMNQHAAPKFNGGTGKARP
mmetsp:Transcript_8524/g.16411  ORF Transcript_8524/g.16411 Transcript_8524/m.16411 type:complete len:116 (+) Transcript_8524:260-607(+)